MIKVTTHAHRRRAQRCPTAASPNDGVRLPRSKARKLVVLSKSYGKTTYYATYSAIWVVSGRKAVTCLALTEEDSAALLVWAAMGIMPD